MQVFAKSDCGLIRENNEDSFLSYQEDGLYAVADGMGGHAAGEIASQEALRFFQKQFKLLRKKGILPGDALYQSVIWANQQVYKKSTQNPEFNGMGTTLTAIWLDENKTYFNWSHVGDSRLYYFQEGSLQLLTKDDSYVEDLLQQGSITPEEAASHPKRNILTLALGTQASIHPQRGEMKYVQGNKLLLCTDGLTNMLDEKNIADILETTTSPEEIVGNLIFQAIAAGGKDNITVIVISL